MRVRTPPGGSGRVQGLHGFDGGKNALFGCVTAFARQVSDCALARDQQLVFVQPVLRSRHQFIDRHDLIGVRLQIGG